MATVPSASVAPLIAEGTSDEQQLRWPKRPMPQQQPSNPLETDEVATSVEDVLVSSSPPDAPRVSSSSSHSTSSSSSSSHQRHSHGHSLSHTPDEEIVAAKEKKKEQLDASVAAVIRHARSLSLGGGDESGGMTPIPARRLSVHGLGGPMRAVPGLPLTPYGNSLSIGSGSGSGSVTPGGGTRSLMSIFSPPMHALHARGGSGSVPSLAHSASVDSFALSTASAASAAASATVGAAAAGGVVGAGVVSPPSASVASSTQLFVDDEQTSTAGHAEALASFRPPSPANVVHVLQRHRLRVDDSDEVVALQSALDHQGDELIVGVRTPCGLEGNTPLPLPIVPQMLMFFHHHVEPEPTTKSKGGGKSSKAHSRRTSFSTTNTTEGSSGSNSHLTLSSTASPSPISRDPSPRPHPRVLQHRQAEAQAAAAAAVPVSVVRSASHTISSSPSHNPISSNSGASEDAEPSASSSGNAPTGSDMQQPSPVPVQQQASGSSLLSPLDSPVVVSTLTDAPTSFSSPPDASTDGFPAPGGIRPQHNLSLSDNTQLLRDLLREYVDLYWENPRAFGAFYKKRSEDMSLAQKADLIYHHLKSRESHAASIIRPVKKLMEKNKKAILAYFEDLLAMRSLRIARIAPQLINKASLCVGAISMMQSAKEEYLQAVNDVVGRLREQFLNVRALVDQRLREHVLAHLDASIPSYEEMNLRILQVLFAPDVLPVVTAYHAAYRQASMTLPGRILLSTLLRNRVESRTHVDDISFGDLIIAVEESTAYLRKSIHGFMQVHPELAEQILHNDAKPSQLERRPATEEGAYSSAKLSELYKRALLAFLRASRIYPKLVSPAVFTLLRKLHPLTDVTTFRLLSENRYQEALWRLHDLGPAWQSQSDLLEDWMHKAVFNDQHVVSVSNLGGGFTTTLLMTMQADDAEIPGLTSHSGRVNGVYKPKPKASIFKLQSLADSIVSNHLKEVAAYRIDKLLHLDHVPLTKSMLWTERSGSLQVFVQNAVSARAVQEINLRKPQAPGKFSAPKGRSMLPRRIRLFDFLIDNRDRNLDNYLISSLDQRIVLIDHGWTFTTPKVANELVHYHNATFLRSLIPHRALFERCRWLHEHGIPLIDAELQHLLSKDNLSAFKYRLKLFVQFVLNEIQAHGERSVFEPANREDCRGLCDTKNGEGADASSNDRSDAPSMDLTCSITGICSTDSASGSASATATVSDTVPLDGVPLNHGGTNVRDDTNNFSRSRSHSGADADGVREVTVGRQSPAPVADASPLTTADLAPPLPRPPLAA